MCVVDVFVHTLPAPPTPSALPSVTLGVVSRAGEGSRVSPGETLYFPFRPSTLPPSLGLSYRLVQFGEKRNSLIS